MSFKSEKKDENLLLKIGGMQCSFCVESIRKALGQLEGVQHSGVSLSHEEAIVQFDPEKIDASTIKDTVKSLGYSLRDPNKIRSFEADQEELRHHRNQLILAFLVSGLALSLMGLSWVDYKPTWLPFVMLGLTLIMIFIIGRSILKMAFASFRRGIYNQHVLMEFGAFGGLFGGIIGFFIQPWPMADFMGAAIFITAYHILSGYVSLVVRQQSSQAIQKLMKLQPDTAKVLKNGNEVEIPTDEVQLGDLVRVRPGESIPVDGEVFEGISMVNQSLVTGESMPVMKTEGDEVIGGSINQNGMLLIKTTKIGQNSFLYQISRSIQEARALKPGILQFVEKVLKFFVPGVLLSALLAFLIWTVGAWIVLGSIQIQTAIFSTLAVLVMGYPCALGMATPLAMIRGGGIAAQQGILMRSGEAFQVFKDVSIIAFDKTGTITEGKPKVVTIAPMNGLEDKELLSFAAMLEQYSDHPLARAITEEAQNRDISVHDQKVTNFEETPGLGVKGLVNDFTLNVGSIRYLEQVGVNIQENRETINQLAIEGQTIVGVAKENKIIGFFGIADTIRQGAFEGIQKIKHLGFDVVLITGDNKRTAESIAKKIGIENVIYEVLPSEKAEQIYQLQREGKCVAMVGDGINDAPALMQADIGIAIGAGTDIAIESADIILVNNEISKIVEAYQIGKNSYGKTKQNVILAFLFNGVGIPLAIAGLLHPVFAMIAMATSVTAVLANSFGGNLFSKSKIVINSDKSRIQDDYYSTLKVFVPDINNEKILIKLEQSLLKIVGVNSVLGNLTSNTIQISYDEDKVTIGDIQDIIENYGLKITNLIF